MLEIRPRHVLLALITAFTLVGIVGMLWLTGRFITKLNKPIPLSLEANNQTRFIATAKTSNETSVETSLIAEKVNLQRKLIVPESPADRAVIESLVKKAGGTVIKSGSSTLVVELPKDTELQITQQLEQQQLISSVEVDYPVFLTGEQVDWGIEKIQVPPVWTTTQGSGVKVAIIDTGIDYTHPDLRNRYVGGYDFVNDDSDPMDDNGHGTHVAGTVAADADGSGYEGAASQASLLGIKVLGADGTGYVSDIVDGIDWAMKQNAQVINFSLGTSYNSSALESKLQQAQSKGIYLVAAAGNTNGGSLLYPAAYTSVISVSATDRNDQFASFSSTGAEVSAPGVGITSSIPGGGYATWSGTSMAAPHVSASVALMIANKQTNIRERLHQTALDLGNSGKDPYFGYGRVVTKPAVLGEDVLAPVITFLEPKNNAEVPTKFTIQLDIQDEFNVTTATLSANTVTLTQWSEAPFTFEWDASEFLNQNVNLVASASDDSGNTGAAQIMVKVVDEVTPSPTATPSPSASASALPISQKAGKSATVRQDATTPAQEVRQDTYHAPQELPSVTNLNQRNPQPAPTSQPSEQSQPPTPSQAEETRQNSQNSGKGNKPEVKGVSTEENPSFFSRLGTLFNSLFGQ